MLPLPWYPPGISLLFLTIVLILGHGEIPLDGSGNAGFDAFLFIALPIIGLGWLVGVLSTPFLLLHGRTMEALLLLFACLFAYPLYIVLFALFYQ